MVLPLIIGIGIDYGIHVVHRFTVDNSIEEVLRHTGKAVFLSALATMIGFGSLGAIGTFRGIATLGILLFIGVGACLSMTS